MSRPGHGRSSLRPDITAQARRTRWRPLPFAPTARTLEVPGARLYHEVRGKGPDLLLVGAPMDAGATNNGTASGVTGLSVGVLTPLAVPMQVDATGRNLVTD
jgi:hypothetical protein